MLSCLWKGAKGPLCHECGIGNSGGNPSSSCVNRTLCDTTIVIAHSTSPSKAYFKWFLSGVDLLSEQRRRRLDRPVRNGHQSEGPFRDSTSMHCCLWRGGSWVPVPRMWNREVLGENPGQFLRQACLCQDCDASHAMNA